MKMSSFDTAEKEFLNSRGDSVRVSFKKFFPKENLSPEERRYIREKYGGRVWKSYLPDDFMPTYNQYVPYKTDDRSSEDVGYSSVNSNLCAFFGSSFTSRVTWARLNGLLGDVEEDYAIHNGDFRNCY